MRIQTSLQSNLIRARSNTCWPKAFAVRIFVARLRFAVLWLS